MNVARAALFAASSVVVVVAGCDDEVYQHSDRVCDGSDGVCSCAADDWCVDYAEGFAFSAGDCAARGGVEDAVACVTDDVAGSCVAAAGCVAAAFHFDSGYDGGLGDSVDVAEAEAACVAGDLIVDVDCAAWVE